MTCTGLKFNGIDNYVSVNNIVFSPTKENTLIVLARPAAVSLDGYDPLRTNMMVYIGPPLPSNANGFGSEQEINLSPDQGKIRFYFGAGTVDYDLWSINSYIPDELYELKVIFKNNGYARMYINGILAASDEIPKQILTANWGAPLYIGRPRANKRFYNGILYSIKIYNDTELVMNHDYTTCSADDLSSYGNNGTVYGATFLDTCPDLIATLTIEL